MYNTTYVVHFTLFSQKVQALLTPVMVSTKVEVAQLASMGTCIRGRAIGSLPYKELMLQASLHIVPVTSVCPSQRQLLLIHFMA